MSQSPLLPVETAELRAHAERAAKARQDGMQLLRNTDTAEYFATSKSQPGTLHRVTLASCDCLGFARHQHCRHHSALTMAFLLQELTETPESTPEPAVEVEASYPHILRDEDGWPVPGGKRVMRGGLWTALGC